MFFIFQIVNLSFNFGALQFYYAHTLDQRLNPMEIGSHLSWPITARVQVLLYYTTTWHTTRYTQLWPDTHNWRANSEFEVGSIIICPLCQGLEAAERTVNTSILKHHSFWPEGCFNFGNTVLARTANLSIFSLPRAKFSFKTSVG